MNLGGPTSHRDKKQDVGYRFALAGRAVAYRDESLRSLLGKQPCQPQTSYQ